MIRRLLIGSISVAGIACSLSVVAAQSWSPDGKRLAFDAIRDRDRELYVFDIESRKLRHYSFNRAEDFHPTFSPDGSRLLFFRGRGHDAGLERDKQEFDVYMLDLRTRRETRLTSFRGYEGDPAWSPDGRRIVFASNHLSHDDNFDVFIKGADRRRNVTRLTDHRAADFSPSFSPDGRKILFVSRRDGHDQIYLMNADGSDQRRLLTSDNCEFQPGWSSDGTRIVFTSQRHVPVKPGETPTYRPVNMDVYVAGADGSGVTRLTRQKGMDASAAFSPDGARIAFLSQRDGDGAPAFYWMDSDGSNVSRVPVPPAQQKAVPPPRPPDKSKTTASHLQRP